MQPAKRFVEYAGAFEQTFVDDDWTRLEPYFAADAIYAVTAGSLLGGRWEGRAQVIEHLRASVNAIDRKFDGRRVEIVGAPIAGARSFEIAWRGSYTKAGCPDLVFQGTERASFEGDCIALLEDTLEEGADERIQRYLAQYVG